LLLGLLHWFRYLALPQGRNAEELEAAVGMFLPVFVTGTDAPSLVPERLLPSWRTWTLLPSCRTWGPRCVPGSTIPGRRRTWMPPSWSVNGRWPPAPRITPAATCSCRTWG
jgi:hypothetical protein